MQGVLLQMHVLPVHRYHGRQQIALWKADYPKLLSCYLGRGVSGPDRE